MDPDTQVLCKELNCTYYNLQEKTLSCGLNRYFLAVKKASLIIQEFENYETKTIDNNGDL